MPASTAALLLDPDRLAVAGALAARPMTTDELASSTGRGARTVLACLGELRGAGLVTADGDRYALDVGALRAAAADQAEADVPMDPAIGFGMTDDITVLTAAFTMVGAHIRDSHRIAARDFLHSEQLDT